MFVYIVCCCFVAVHRELLSNMLCKQGGKPSWCWQWAFLIALSLLFAGCSKIGQIGPDEPYRPKVKTGKPYKVFGKTYYPLKSSEGFVQEGLASWYGKKFHNRLTANGEIYDMYAITAAHKTLPLPTWVWVLNLENHRGMVIRINDRGPFVGDRIIDLSYAAAQVLGSGKAGIAKVRISALPLDAQHNMESEYQSKLKKNKKKRIISRHVVKSESIEKAGGVTAFETVTKPKLKPAKKKKLVRKARKSKSSYWPLNGGYVQAGSFQNFNNAQKFAARLMTVGKARVQNKKVGRKTFYRVVLGPFDSKIRANNVVKRLKNMGVSSPSIIAK
jgi:rare lipoprotein A